MKLSTYVSGAVRQFSYWFAHGNLGYPLLEGIDYIGEILKEESSFAEQTFAIFMNNLEIDGDGSVINYKNRRLKSLSPLPVSNRRKILQMFYSVEFYPH